jgi:vitamin B12 transporter
LGGFPPKLSSTNLFCRNAEKGGNNMVKKILFGAAAGLCLCLFLTGDEPDGENGKDSNDKLTYTVTVTANRLETPERETASSLTVLNREELRAAGIRTVVEALQETVGLNVIQNGPPGSAASVFIRGGDTAQTKIMLDGVELNDPVTPSRSFDFSHLMVDSIDRIEIIRGPQSPLYGSDAMAGVINIISRMEQGRPRVRLSSQGGSFGTLSGNAEAAGGNDNVQYSAGASYYQTQGFSAAGTQYAGNSEADGYRNLTLSGKINVHLQDNLEWMMSARGLQTRTDLDNMGGAFGDDPNHTGTYDSLILHTGLRGLFAHNRWESRLNLSYVNSARRYDNPADEAHPFSAEDAEYLSNTAKLNWQNNIFIHSANTLTLGLEFLREQGESTYASTSSWGETLSFFPKNSADTIGVFIQDRVSADDRFFLTLGGRWDQHSRAGGALTYRAAPSYLIESTGTRLKATLGTGFKAPSLYQLYAPDTLWGPVGNLELEPERSLGWDAGFEQDLFGHSLIFGATYFSNRFRNLIDFDYTQGYINVGEASTRGIELYLESKPLDNLSFHSAYTYQKAANEATGEALLRRPQHKFTLEGRATWMDSLKIRLLLIYMGQRQDMFYSGFTSTRVILDDYVLLNSALSYDFMPGFSLTLRMDNMLNQEYELVKGYGTPGFSVYGGIAIEI